MNHAVTDSMNNSLAESVANQAAGLPGWAAIVSWALQLAVAAILAQTLFFKFTYAPETQVIFGNLGGRPAATAVGMMELTCVVLLLVPQTVVLGAVLALGTISGAIVLHLTVLGLEIIDPATGKGDGGLLFGLALAVTIGSALIIVLRWKQLLGFVRLVF